MTSRIRQFSSVLIWLASAVAIALLAFACIRPTKSRLDEISIPGSQSTLHGEKTLIVLLPGIKDKPIQFEENGFIEDIKSFDPSVDLIAVDIHLGYYLEQSFITRLKKDVIDPAKKRGYDNIWLVGVSLGGYGALSYMLSRPQDISKVFIMSPYLGHDNLIHEIKKSGGLSKWQSSIFLQFDWRRKLWTWIKDFSIKQDIYPPVYIGIAKQDEFFEANQLFAELLPPKRVLVVEGGHNWQAWRRMWLQFFAREYGVVAH